MASRPLFTQGNTYHGFEALMAYEVDSIHGTAYRMMHRTSGAELLWMDCDDPEMGFSISFKTRPADNSGVFHVLEHSVLDGSVRYPVKSPFSQMLRTSASTYLNALTAQGATMYPFSTANATDFINLMRVYMDAVSEPLLLTDPDIVSQEACHLDFDGENLQFSGVVFNEMRGALSEPARQVFQLMGEQLFGDSCLGYCSGGKPEGIARLTHEQVVDTHQRHYRPDNALITIYGGIDPDEVLRVLDEEYLTEWHQRAKEYTGGINPADRPIGRVNAPYTKYSAIAPGTGTALWACVLPDDLDFCELQAIGIVTTALMGADDAPLGRALLNTGLASAFSPLVDDDGAHIFALLAPGCQEGTAAELARQFPRLLKMQMKQGLDRDAIDAAIDAFEYHLRERSDRTPTAVALPRTAISRWIWGKSPIEPLMHDALIDWLRELPTQTYAGLLSLILSSGHTCSIEVIPGEPEPDPTEAILAELQQDMSTEELQEIAEKAAAVEARRSTPDTPEALACLPKLRLADMAEAPRMASATTETAEGVELLTCDVQTDGLAYVSAFYDVTDMAEEDLPWLALLCSVTGDTTLPGMSAEELVKVTGHLLGDYDCSLSTNEHMDGSLRIHVHMDTGMLGRCAVEGAELACRLLAETQLDDLPRLGEIIMQADASCGYKISGQQNRLARVRALAGIRQLEAADDRIIGIGGIEFIRSLAAQASREGGLEEIAAKLDSVRREVLAIGPDFICYAGPDSAREAAQRTAQILGKMADPASHQPAEHPLSELPVRGAQTEQYHDPGDVAFLYKAYDLRETMEHDASLVVAKSVLDAVILWNEIRVKGGAYGANSAILNRRKLGVLSTYRDPSPAASLEVFEKIPQLLREMEVTPEQLEGHAISVLAKLDAPENPSNALDRITTWHINGYTLADRMRSRQQVLNCDASCLLRLADALEGAPYSICAIVGETCTPITDTVKHIVEQ